MDFNLKIYKDLLKTLQQQSYTFQTFASFLKSAETKTIILRHDVDKLPLNSLKFAEIENALGIKGSYYFRIVPESYNINVIKEIHSLGHEIGYHYEDVSLTVSFKKQIAEKNSKTQNSTHFEHNRIEKAFQSFKENLAKNQKYCPS